MGFPPPFSTSLQVGPSLNFGLAPLDFPFPQLHSTLAWLEVQDLHHLFAMSSSDMIMWTPVNQGLATPVLLLSRLYSTLTGISSFSSSLGNVLK